MRSKSQQPVNYPNFTLEQAAKYLQEKLPMDEQTARQEAIAFSTSPGAAMTYQIGKLQILKFLADARMQQGEKFNLRGLPRFRLEKQQGSNRTARVGILSPE